MRHSPREELSGILVLVGAMWGIYLLDWILPAELSNWGIVPRTAWGLVGIPFAPLLHGSLSHLLSNTVPLFVLLFLLAGSRTRSWETVIEIVVLGGGLLWLFGRNANHIGASGLVYGLIAFLIAAGFRERRVSSILVALLVGFLYGGTLLTGVLPTVGEGVSWDGHLLSAVAGAILGFWGIADDKKESGNDAQPSA